jgi:hypothetical protein
LAEEAIDEYFENIDGTVDKIVDSIIEKYGLDDNNLGEEDRKFLKERIMRGILKWDKENVKTDDN